MDVVDVEATLNEELRNFDLLLSGGVRYGRQSIRPPGLELRFEGIGPTLSMHASREVGTHGLELVGNLRTSLLIGEFHFSPGIGARTDDEIQTVLEPQLGVAYTRQVGHLELSSKLVYETQFWLNDALTEIALADSSSILFSGPTISFQARF